MNVLRLPMTLLVIVSLFMVDPVSSAEIAPTKDSLATIKRNIAKEKAILVDVREKSEWDKGHVKDALFMPLSELQDNAAELAKKLPKDKIIYTHCVVGKRAATAAEILTELGYEVRPIKPGYKELIKAGFPPAK